MVRESPAGLAGRTRLEVHIVPVAREVDRAALPFVPRPGRPPVLHAHKVILLVPRTDQARRIAQKLEKILKPIALVERYDLETDRERVVAGFQRVLQQIARLCLAELEQGNRVHINLSSGSKMVAFAAGLAGMAHIRPGHGSLYYVQPAEHSLTQEELEEHGSTRGMISVEEFELMPVLLPEPLQLRVISFLRYQDEGRASYRDLLGYLNEIPGSEFGREPKSASALRVRNWNNAATTRMVRKVLSPLEENGLIEIRIMRGQKGAHLTSRGLLYASISGLDQRSLRRPLAPYVPHGPRKLVEALMA